MGFPENILTKDEKVVRDLRPHWLTVFLPSVWGVLIVAAVILIAVLTPPDPTWDIVQWVVVAIGVIGLIWFVLIPFLKWRTTHYVITNKRVAVRRGILTKSGQDIALSKITDVSFRQTLLDRITRSGSLSIETAGDNDDEDFTNIPRSNEVQQVLNRLIEDDAASRGWGGPYAGHPAPYDAGPQPDQHYRDQGYQDPGPQRDGGWQDSAPRGGDTRRFAAPPPQQPPQGDGWETPPTR